jgi:hypothetical protein
MKKSAVATVAVAAGMVAAAVAIPAANAATPVDTTALRDAVTVDGVRQHQAAFQAIASANGGTRSSSTPGFDQSAEYVAGLMAAAGYEVTVQPFDFPFFQELAPAVLDQVLPNPTVHPNGDDAGFDTMEYSGSGDVTAPAEGVDLILPPGAAANTSTSGCEASDFADFTAATSPSSSAGRARSPIRRSTPRRPERQAW